MSHFKKIIIGVIIFVLCFGVLQGCSKKSDISTASESSTIASEATTTVISEDKTDVAIAQDESQDLDSTTSNWKEICHLTIEQKTYYAGFLTDTFGLTVGEGGVIHYTNDGGKTWPAAENKSACRFGLDMLNANFGLTSGNNGDNRITRDGGKTWQEITSYGVSQPGHIRYDSIVDENTFWIASTNKIACSVDSGKTWQEIEKPDGMKPISAITFQTADEGVVLNAKGTLFVTKDGGKTWNEQNIDFQKLNLKGDQLYSSPSAPMACLRFTDPQNAVLALYGSLKTDTNQIIILKTTDGGKTWESEILPGSYPVSSVFLSRDAKYLTLYNTNNELIVLRDME